MSITNLSQLEEKMGLCWQEILSRPLASEIGAILSSGDKKLYALWLSQVAHLTKFTSAHQALVATRVGEIPYSYMKFCLMHALEEVGHELMAVSDLKKIGANIEELSDLPEALPATNKMTAYLYYAAERAHPMTRLGFSYWAEKCYPYIAGLANNTKNALGLSDRQMTFFVNHATIDEKHAADVEQIIQMVCKTDEDWNAVATGMVDTLNLALGIFEEIHQVAIATQNYPQYQDFLSSISVHA